MHSKTELTRENVRHTELIKFWSEGKIAQSAHERILNLQSKRKRDIAKVVMSEWIL
jgi:hypothetical protein